MQIVMNYRVSYTINEINVKNVKKNGNLNSVKKGIKTIQQIENSAMLWYILYSGMESYTKLRAKPKCRGCISEIQW